MRRAFALTALLLAGCQATVSSGLDEAQANEIIVALDREGIAAEKSTERGGQSRWRVTVADGDFATSLDVLSRARIPQPAETGVEELFDDNSLVPSASAQRTRQAAALGGELARTLEAVDGVVSARVHVALPSTTRFSLDDEPAARASVLLRHEGERPPLTDDEVAALVAGSVVGLSTDGVEVVATTARSAAIREPQLAWVGPIAVSHSTVGTLKVVLGTSFALNAILAVALLYVVVRRRRSGLQRLTAANEA